MWNFVSFRNNDLIYVSSSASPPFFSNSALIQSSVTIEYTIKIFRTNILYHKITRILESITYHMHFISWLIMQIVFSFSKNLYFLLQREKEYNSVLDILKELNRDSLKSFLCKREIQVLKTLILWIFYLNIKEKNL